MNKSSLTSAFLLFALELTGYMLHLNKLIRATVASQMRFESLYNPGKSQKHES